MASKVMATCIAAALSGLTAAAQPRFTQPPKVAAENGGLTVSFAVDRPTDVEVAILDAAGRVVRHLAAGKLGPKAPAPLRPNALRQSLVWDRRDDAGRLVRGPVKVRVRVGLTGRLEKQLGFDPYNFRAIVGLAVNAKGELFVLDSQGTYGASGLRVFDRQGKYLRTVIPYSASLPAGRLASIGQLTLKDGRRLPIVYNAHGQNLHPYTSGMKHQTMAIDPAGRLVFFSAVGSIVEHGPPRFLLFLEPDGGAPKTPGFIGPPLLKARGFLHGAGEGPVRYYDHLAVSPDGQFIYVSGGPFGRRRHRHVIYRIRPTDKKLPSPRLGELYKRGDDEKHFNDPQGLTADAAGRLYIADRGNDRVVIHSPGGKRIGQFPAPDPLQIFVHPRSGEIYISSAPADQYGRIKNWKLLKLSPFKPGGPPPKVLAEAAGQGTPVVALDAAAQPTRLWVAAASRSGQDLLPVIDRGAKLEMLPGLRRRAGLRQPMFVAADAHRGKVYVTEFRNAQRQIDIKTGRMRPFAKGAEAAVDRDGFVYVIEGYPPRVFLYRYDPQGKPANFPGTSSNKVGPIDTASKGPHVGFRGHTVAPNGDIYILQMKFYGDGRVVVYGPDGKLKSEGLVKNIPNGSGGIAVDRAGNVFVAANLKRPGEVFPPEFAGLVPETRWVWWRSKRPAPWDRPYYNAYLYHWGSVFKFAPAGGAFYPGYKEVGKGGRGPMQIPADAVVYNSGYLNAKVGVKGALWYFRGYGPIPPGNLNWGDPSCTCMGARFSVDDFGRLFVPDVFSFAVNVLDASGNLITRLGHYGNADDPGLALAWGAYTSCSGGKLFISDMANRRVLMVGLASAASAVVDVPSGK